MSTSAYSRYAFSIVAVAALLTGCGGSQLPIGAPRAMQQTAALAVRGDASTYEVVYGFGGGCLSTSSSQRDFRRDARGCYVRGAGALRDFIDRADRRLTHIRELSR